MKCDFPGNDFGYRLIRGEECGGACGATSECTHYAWSPYQGGTCWLKRGAVSKWDAIYTGNQNHVCGVIKIYEL